MGADSALLLEDQTGLTTGQVADTFNTTAVDIDALGPDNNTGFGRLANVRISPDDLARLQEKLIISHAAGVGDPLPIVEARLAVAIRAATLAGGHSGVKPETLKSTAASETIPYGVHLALGLGGTLLAAIFRWVPWVNL